MKGLIVSILLAGLLSGCDRDVTVEEPRLRPVRTITVSEPVTVRTRTFSGSSKSSRESRLSFKVAGTVVEIPVQVGDDLKAGDLVARLDPSQYELQLQQAQASLVQAEASARNAEANYNRVKGLYENSNASRNDLDSARAVAESARAQQRAQEKSLELARLNLSYTRLLVNADCSLADLSVEVNENVAAGSQVARVNCGQELEVNTDVPESVIAGISQGMAVTIRFNSLPGDTFEGRVIEVGVASDGTSSTFPVSVRVEEPDPALRSGLAAEVSFSFTSKSVAGTHLVPLTAVVNDADGPYVYVAEPVAEAGQAIVRRKPVRLGELTEAGMQVQAGLATGDRVITAGVSVIREGQRVLVP